MCVAFLLKGPGFPDVQLSLLAFDICHFLSNSYSLLSFLFKFLSFSPAVIFFSEGIIHFAYLVYSLRNLATISKMIFFF